MLRVRLSARAVRPAGLVRVPRLPRRVRDRSRAVPGEGPL